MKVQWAARHVLDMDTQWKICRETIATCARCSWQAHNKNKCTSTEVRCCHCGADHQAFSRNCPINKRETGVVQIQTKERILRLQVVRKLLNLNKNPELIFSNAVINTSNWTPSKSSNRTHQESQSKSSEDNSPPVPSYSHGYYTQGKVKNKRSPPSPPLTVGGVRRKKTRKWKTRRREINFRSFFPQKSKASKFQVQISINGTSKE